MRRSPIVALLPSNQNSNSRNPTTWLQTMERVLVACEYSAIVRDAFACAGWDAWSCDILPTEGNPDKHIVGDCTEILGDGWDLMVAHPPCTYLAVSGMHWTTRGLRDPQLTEDALELVRVLMSAPIPRIAVENPVSVISTRIRKPDQIIQPYQFGVDASKQTCLWLKGLPPLLPTHYMVSLSGLWGNQTPSGQNSLPPSPTRWKDRSRTYKPIAEAMATQWGGLRKNRVASVQPKLQIA